MSEYNPASRRVYWRLGAWWETRLQRGSRSFLLSSPLSSHSRLSLRVCLKGPHCACARSKRRVMTRKKKRRTRKEGIIRLYLKNRKPSVFLSSSWGRSVRTFSQRLRRRVWKCPTIAVNLFRLKTTSAFRADEPCMSIRATSKTFGQDRKVDSVDASS